MNSFSPPTAMDSNDSETAESTPWYWGNMTPWWFLVTIYCLVFVFYMGFRAFGAETAAAFIIHTLLALYFVVACAWNLLHTPSQGALYRKIHQGAGRVAVLSGTFVVVTGYVLILTGQTQLSVTAQRVFMAVGAFQIIVQAALVFFVRRQGIHNHMVAANILFYSCAFLPALNRAPQIFGFPDGDIWTIIAIPIGFVLTFISIYYYARKMEREKSSETSLRPDGNDSNSNLNE
jgi:hypothetical protein